MSDLAEALDVSVASATGIVGRMERRGLVERGRTDDDRRVIMVSLTPTGSVVFGDMRANRRDRLAALIERLSDAERAGFLAGLRAMRVAAEQLYGSADEAAQGQASRSDGPAVSAMRLLRRYLLPYRLQLALIVVLVTIQAIANLYLPNLNADIINNGVVTGDIDLHPPDRRVHAGGHVPARRSARSSASTGRRQTAMAFGRDVRDAIFRKVLSFSRRRQPFGPPSLITRNTNDVQQVQTVLVLALNVMILAPIMAVGGVIMALREDVALSWLLS